MTWLAAHQRRISLGASVALIAAGTLIAFGVTIWGLLPRRDVASRWAAAADLMALLSGSNAAPLWLIAPLAISTSVLFPALVFILASVRVSRRPWLGAAGTGVAFALAATAVTGLLLGAEMAIWLDADPPMSLPMKLLLPVLGAGMAPPVALLLLPLHLVVGGALYGMLVAAFVTPTTRRLDSDAG